MDLTPDQQAQAQRPFEQLQGTSARGRWSRPARRSSGNVKGAGRRWGEDGADALCHVRALFRREPTQWEAFWGHN